MYLEERTPLALFIFQSDLIDGIGGRPEDFREICSQLQFKEVAGHAGVMLMLNKMAEIAMNQYVDDALIQKIQRLITVEQGLRFGGHSIPVELVGSYRTKAIEVYKKIDFLNKCPAAEQVPALMEKLIKRINWWQQNSRFQLESFNLKYLAELHYQFLRISPFAYGNGRTARALNYFLMRYESLQPIIFTDYDKLETYFPSIAQETPYNMIGYFKIKYKLNPARTPFLT